jgi:hypothetical protein
VLAVNGDSECLCVNHRNVQRIVHYKSPFLACQLSVFSTPANNRVYRIAWFQFWGGHTYSGTHEFILVQVPSMEVVALRPVGWYWVKTDVTRGEQSAQMVHVLKGVWISCPLSEGLESFYRWSWGPLTMVQFLHNSGWLHDKWGLTRNIIFRVWRRLSGYLLGYQAFTWLEPGMISCDAAILHGFAWWLSFLMWGLMWMG